MSPEPDRTVVPVPILEDLLTSEGYLGTATPQRYLRQQLVVSSEDAAEVAKVTTGQRTNQLWCLVRKLRITASNFGPVLTSIRTNR